MVDRDPRGPVIWDKSGSPTRRVSEVLGIEAVRVRRALHKLKRHEGLGPSDDVVIFANGDVISKASGDDIGNILED